MHAQRSPLLLACLLVGEACHPNTDSVLDSSGPNPTAVALDGWFQLSHSAVQVMGDDGQSGEFSDAYWFAAAGAFVTPITVAAAFVDPQASCHRQDPDPSAVSRANIDLGPYLTLGVGERNLRLRLFESGDVIEYWWDVPTVNLEPRELHTPGTPVKWDLAPETLFIPEPFVDVPTVNACLQTLFVEGATTCEIQTPTLDGSWLVISVIVEGPRGPYLFDCAIPDTGSFSMDLRDHDLQPDEWVDSLILRRLVGTIAHPSPDLRIQFVVEETLNLQRMEP